MFWGKNNFENFVHPPLIIDGCPMTGYITPKVPYLCPLCLITLGRDILPHLNISQLGYTFRRGKSLLLHVDKHEEQRYATFGVTYLDKPLKEIT